MINTTNTSILYSTQMHTWLEEPINKTTTNENVTENKYFKNKNKKWIGNSLHEENCVCVIQIFMFFLSISKN